MAQHVLLVRINRTETERQKHRVDRVQLLILVFVLHYVGLVGLWECVL